MPVQVPESYLAYCTDRVARTAVDHILKSKNTLDVPILEWDDLLKFHRAVLSAHQVRCGFAIFLHELWDAVWKPALKPYCGRQFFIPKGVEETRKHWNENHLDTYSIWDNEWFGRVFDIANTKLALELGTSAVSAGTEGVRLSLFLMDKKSEKDSMAKLDLDDRWSLEDIDDGNDVYPYAYSRKKLAPIVDGRIDLAPLHKAAADALAAVEHCASSPRSKSRRSPASVIG